jgi:DNA-binding beta-propeller fold protein YncE
MIRGHLYTADLAAIRAIDLSTRQVTTLAGHFQPGYADGAGDAARFNSVDGLALDAAGNLYVADRVNNTIRKVVIATADVTTLACAGGIGGTLDGIGAAARFDFPTGLAFDGAVRRHRRRGV